MRRFLCITFCLVVLLPVAATTRPAAPGLRLQALAKTITFDWARAHPIVATELGLTQYDGDLERPSVAQRARDLAQIRTWESELSSISLAGANLRDRDDAALLRAHLIGMEREYTVYKTAEKDYAGPANAVVNALFLQFQYLPVAGREGATQRDVALACAHITTRLQKAPAYIAGGERLVVHPGHLYGVVGAQELAETPGFLDGALTQAMHARLHGAELAAFLRARDATVARITETVRYIRAQDASWPESYAIGRAAYDAMLRDEELLPFDSEAIVRMGADELAHGSTEQIWIENLARIRGTPIGPLTGGGLAPGGTALIAYYRERLAELKRWTVAHRVVTVPSWLGDVRVVETPKFLQPVSPGASMQAPRLFASETTGFYYITPPVSLAGAARTLDPNEDFDRDRIWSTAAHETIPGHFLQMSIARRNPDFVRRIGDSGVFAEGWAFYGEEMFVRLGLYGDDLDGRYDVAQWERVRGARATVDPKLASGEWSYDRAARFFAQATGFPPSEAREAVAGIALGPGYVISYTAGRYQLENLLNEYWQRMGKRADLEDFHDRLMCYGTVPFAVVAPELLADLDKPLAKVRAAARY